MTSEVHNLTASETKSTNYLGKLDSLKLRTFLTE